MRAYRLIATWLSLVAAAMCAPGLVACGDASATSDGEETEDAVTSGAATIQIERSPMVDGSLLSTVRQSTTDGHLLVGQELTLNVLPEALWTVVHPHDPIPGGVSPFQAPRPEEIARWRQISGKLEVRFLKGGIPLRTRSVSLAHPWDDPPPTGGYRFPAYKGTAVRVIPTGTDTIQFRVTATDTAAPRTTSTVDFDRVTSKPVVGSAVATKARTVLFDNDDRNGKRQKVIEGTSLYKGGTAAMTYSGVRANIVSNYGTLDDTIGTAVSHNDGQPYNVRGIIEHDVAYGATFDGRTFLPEALFQKVTDSPLLSNQYPNFQGSLSIPTSATKVALYFHITSFVVAKFPMSERILTRRYEEGARVKLRETWDNPSGPNSNFEFHVQ